MTPIQPPAQPSQSDFLTRWERSGAAERANYQLFLSELCDYLDLPRPDPAQPDDSLNNYTFEKPVHFRDPFIQSTGRIPRKILAHLRRRRASYQALKLSAQSFYND